MSRALDLMMNTSSMYFRMLAIVRLSVFLLMLAFLVLCLQIDHEPSVWFRDRIYDYMIFLFDISMMSGGPICAQTHTRVVHSSVTNRLPFVLFQVYFKVLHCT